MAMENGNGALASAAGPHDWSTPLFDCCSQGAVCFHGFFVNCITYSEIHYRLDHPEDVQMKKYSDVNTPCIICSVVSIIPPMACIMSWRQRVRARKAMNIKGSDGSDFVTSLFCHCCDLIQTDVELKKWQEGEGIYKGTQPAAREGMEYAPA